MAGYIDKIKGGALIVDVRTAEEYGDEHYENALNVPVDQVQSRLSEFGDKTKPVVVYVRRVRELRVPRMC